MYAHGRRREAARWLLRAIRYDPSGRGMAIVIGPIVRRRLRRAGVVRG
jgi:hypothetical protein